MLRHIIREYSVRISKPCMDCVSLYGIVVFLREVITLMLYIPIIMYIQEGCFEIRFHVFIIFFNWRYVM